MRAVVQRVARSSVAVDGQEVGAIGVGLCVLLGVSQDDDESDAVWMADKIVNLRIFEDSDDKLNLSLADVGGSLLAVSQFTLYGDCRKGRRPSFIEAARPEQAQRLYDLFVDAVRERGVAVATGIFQTHMAVSILNDGPVTLIVQSPREAQTR